MIRTDPAPTTTPKLGDLNVGAKLNLPPISNASGAEPVSTSMVPSDPPRKEEPPKKVEVKKETNAQADAAAANVKEGLDTLITYKKGGIPVGDEGFTNGFKQLLTLHAEGSHAAIGAIVEIGKQEKATALRVLNALSTEKGITDERKATIAEAVAKIDPPKKPDDAPKKVEIKATNAQADATAANIKDGLDTLITYKKGGIPVGDEGFTNGFNQLLKLHTEGSHAAVGIIAGIGKQEKTTALRVLKSLSEETGISDERKATIAAVVAKIDPPKSVDKK